MIGVDKLETGQWYDGFLWYDTRQKSVACLRWRSKDALFDDTQDSRVYPHVAEPRLPKVWTFEPNTKGVNPHEKSDSGTTGEAA
jgi:hypothetical protein